MSSVAGFEELSLFGERYGSSADAVVKALLDNNTVLRRELDWEMFRFASKRHWAAVLKPIVDDETAKFQLDRNLLRPSLRRPAEPLPEGDVMALSWTQCFLVFELIVVKQFRVFALQVTVMPDFDITMPCVTNRGRIQRMTCASFKQHAQEVMQRYTHYGWFGTNCQHFTRDFLEEIEKKALEAAMAAEKERTQQTLRLLDPELPDLRNLLPQLQIDGTEKARDETKEPLKPLETLDEAIVQTGSSYLSSSARLAEWVNVGIRVGLAAHASKGCWTLLSTRSQEGLQQFLAGLSELPGNAYRQLQRRQRHRGDDPTEGEDVLQ